MRQRVLLPERIAGAGVNYLENHGYEIVYGSRDPEDMIGKLSGCEAVITRNVRITKEMMLAAPGLRVIARHGVGVDMIDTEAAKELGIWVTNAPESNTNAVAEQVIGAMLTVARKLILCNDLVRRGDYDRRTQIGGMELAGKTLGVVGFGRIGRCVARKAALGLDMAIAVYDPYLKEEPEEYGIQITESLEELLRISDVVTLHVPLLESNRHMMGREQFLFMKEHGILINYARGALTDQEALAEALKEGRIAGAAVDVFENEPVTADNPLCGLEQVLLTPHTASFTGESLDKMALHSAMTVHQVLSGQKPTWCVVAGYR